MFILWAASFVDLLVAFAANPHLFAVFHHLGLNPDRGHAVIAHQHHLGPVNGCFGFDDTAFAVFHIGSGMLLDHIDVLDDNTAFLPVDPKDLADFSGILSGHDLDFVIFFQMALGCVHHRSTLQRR